MDPVAIHPEDDPQGAAPAPPPRHHAVAPPGRTRWASALFHALLHRRRVWAVAVLLGMTAVAVLLGAPSLTAWYHLRAARRADRLYHNHQAIVHLKACLQIWPQNPDALLLAARTARRANAYAEAEHCLDQYQRVCGLDEVASLERILLTVEQSCPDPVASLCRRQIEQGHPEAALILEALARGYLRHYRLLEASECLDRWLRLLPDDTQALCLQGQLHLDYEHARLAAIASYRRAVELDPEHDQARLGLAVALLETNSFAEAASHLEVLRQHQPDNLRIAVGLAECRYGLGDRAAALEILDHILARRAGYAPALSLRARLVLNQGTPTAEELGAIEGWLREVLAADPKDSVARSNLILCLQLDGKDGEAQRQREEEARRKADQQRFHEITTTEIGRRPNDPSLHCQLGELLLRSGYAEEGLRWLHSALRLDPGYAPAREALAGYQRRAVGK